MSLLSARASKRKRVTQQPKSDAQDPKRTRVTTRVTRSSLENESVPENESPPERNANVVTKSPIVSNPSYIITWHIFWF